MKNGKINSPPIRVRPNRLLAILLSVIIGLTAVAGTKISFQSPIEQELIRSLFYLRGERETPKSVLIVRLDPKMTQSKQVLAEATRILTSHDAKAIIFDVIFTRSKNEADFTAALADAPTVIGHFVRRQPGKAPAGTTDHSRVIWNPAQDYNQNSDVFDVAVSSINGLVGNISLGSVRGTTNESAVPLLRPLRKYVAPNLAQPATFDLINFVGGPSSIESASILDVIQRKPEVLELVADRVVFVGFVNPSGNEKFDVFETLFPAATPTPGVEIHATIASNLINGNWIRRPSRLATILAVAMLAMALAYYTFLAPIAHSSLAATLVAASVVAVTWISFQHFLLFLPVTPLLTRVFPLVAVIWIARAIVTSKRTVVKTPAVETQPALGKEG